MRDRHVGIDTMLVEQDGCALPGTKFITFAGWLSTVPLHDLVESLKIRPRSPVREEPSSLQSGNLLRHGGSKELVHARSFLPAHRLTASLRDRGNRSGSVVVCFTV